MKIALYILILGTSYHCFGATSEPGLLFYLSGDHEFTADYAAGILESVRMMLGYAARRSP